MTTAARRSKLLNPAPATHLHLHSTPPSLGSKSDVLSTPEPTRQRLSDYSETSKRRHMLHSDGICICNYRLFPSFKKSLEQLFPIQEIKSYSCSFGRSIVVKYKWSFCILGEWKLIMTTTARRSKLLNPAPATSTSFAFYPTPSNSKSDVLSRGSDFIETSKKT
ncbi:hypothetical protein CEXT_92681 [Caerostris extrusa]|uniref:Uncharacterized protein n=1 Tax=Caerostris extrusa TaxID=172846 RepID=A0AAV4SEM8_CAEEX|nr:hypothetical protein CEXT_92681 [Caerostris extrusa]